MVPVNKTVSGDDATSLDVNQSESTTDIPQGFGRIIRDCHGNIVDVDMGEQETTISIDEGVPIQDEEMERWLGKHSNDSKSTALIQG